MASRPNLLISFTSLNSHHLSSAFIFNTINRIHVFPDFTQPPRSQQHLGNEWLANNYRGKSSSNNIKVAISILSSFKKYTPDTPWKFNSSPLQMALPKRKGLSSNHPFFMAKLAVRLRRCISIKCSFQKFNDLLKPI